MDTTEELNGTYFYGGYSNATHVQLFWLVGVQVVSEHLGLAATDAALVLAGQPLIPTRAKPGSATKGTSVASLASRYLLNYRFPKGMLLPTLNGKTISQLHVSWTNHLGAFVGRNVPWLGWIMTFTTVYNIFNDIRSTYNRVARPEHRIQWTYF